MQKKVLFEKINEQRSKLIEKLSSFDVVENLSPSELQGIIKELEFFTKDLIIATYLKENQEKHNELNVHLKIMENISKQEETKAIISPVEKDVQKDEPEIKPIEIKQERVEPIASIEIQKETAEENKIITKKKIEFGLNDKYRIINELFHQSPAEFSAAVDQLNLTDSWEDAESYLNNLKSIYSWKQEHPMVKLIYNFTQKRFQ